MRRCLSGPVLQTEMITGETLVFFPQGRSSSLVTSMPGEACLSVSHCVRRAKVCALAFLSFEHKT